MKNYKLEVVEDMHPYNPRKDDNITKLICFHNRYNLGDEHSYKHSNYNNWEELEADIIKQENAAIIYPLYLYDHSGITISTSPFGDRWDSGQVGFVYVSKQTIYKEYNCKRITKAIRLKAESLLQAEVKTYDKYIMGEAWGFRITDENESEVDSCWGYYEKHEAEMDGKSRLEYLLNKEAV
jgi:hypothetical protein